MKKVLDLRHYYLLPISEKLRKIYDDSCFEVLSLWRKQPGRENLEVMPEEIESLCDAYFLIRSGAISCELVDYHPGVENEAVIIGINSNDIRDH